MDIGEVVKEFDAVPRKPAIPQAVPEQAPSVPAEPVPSGR